MFLFSLWKPPQKKQKTKTLSRADETLNTNRHKFPSTKFTKEEKWLLLLMVPPFLLVNRYTPRPPHYRRKQNKKRTCVNSFAFFLPWIYSNEFREFDLGNRLMKWRHSHAELFCFVFFLKKTKMMSFFVGFNQSNMYRLPGYWYDAII